MIKLWGLGRLNLKIEFLQTLCYDFKFKLPKIKLHTTFIVSVSSMGVFNLNLFRFNEMGCYE